MKSKPFTKETILHHLRDHGMRITETRRNILSVLFQANAPLTLNDIQYQIASKKKSSDYTTIFRFISLLEKLHVVERVNLQKASSYYELRNPEKHYDHLICTICGKVQRLNMPCPVESFEKQLKKVFGFQTDSHSLEFFGRCHECTV